MKRRKTEWDYNKSKHWTSHWIISTSDHRQIFRHKTKNRRREHLRRNEHVVRLILTFTSSSSSEHRCNSVYKIIIRLFAVCLFLNQHCRTVLMITKNLKNRHESGLKNITVFLAVFFSNILCDSRFVWLLSL